MENTEAGNVPGRKNVIKIDDMLCDNYLAEKFPDTGNSFREVIKCLDGDREALSMRLEERKATIMALAEKDIKKIRMISELEETLSTQQKRFDNLSEEKFKIEDQLEQQKTAYERERQRLTGEMDKITKSHKDELKNERKRMESQIAKKDKDIELEIKKLQAEISMTKGENAKQTAIAENLKQQLHTMRMETEQQLQETYRNQENEYKAFRNEIKEQKDKLQLLNYKLNQTQQEKESYFQQVQVLTAEKQDLLLRKEDNETDDQAVINGQSTQLALILPEEKQSTALHDDNSDKETQAQKPQDTGSLSKIIDLLKEDIADLSCKLEREKATNKELADKHFISESQIEALEIKRQKLARQMEEKINVHKVELNNERQRAKAEIERKYKEIQRQTEEIGEKDKYINKLKKELSNIKRSESQIEALESKNKRQKLAREMEEKINVKLAGDVFCKELYRMHSNEEIKRIFPLHNLQQLSKEDHETDDQAVKNGQSTQLALTLPEEKQSTALPDDNSDKENQTQKPQITGSLSKIIELLKEDVAELSGKLEREKATNKELADKYFISESQIEAIENKRKKLAREMEEKINVHKVELNNERQRAKAEIERKHKEIKRQKEEIGEKDKYINKLKKELSNIKRSESTASMTYNNPNIADLSDEKRPTKLAEDFAELYDNEWTDAFEEIEGENEEDKLTFMLELLKRANQHCQDLSNGHTKKVKQSLSTLTLLMPNKQEQNRSGDSLVKYKLRQGKQEQIFPEVANRKDSLQQSKPNKQKLESDFEKLQTEQKKTILEATNFFETLLSEDVKKAVMEVIVNEKGIDDEKQKCVVAYIAKCIDICWSMIRHKPPVHVDFQDMTCDIPFDTDKYKPYTKTGKHLAYIVWPALYLHEAGPLLSKGTAQGKELNKVTPR